eukprot:scaffold178_cov255-Pinguiococcus_pyrenoidosus.AAC.5
MRLEVSQSCALAYCENASPVRFLCGAPALALCVLHLFSEAAKIINFVGIRATRSSRATRSAPPAAPKLG